MFNFRTRTRPGGLIAGEATPPSSGLIYFTKKFSLSYDLREGKKSTPVRAGAPARKLASDRAGVGFLFDTGDGGARIAVLAKFDLCQVEEITSNKRNADWMGWVRQGGEGYLQSDSFKFA